MARKLQPLTDGLRGGRKGADKLEWSAAMDAAFARAKQAFLSATHLAHPGGEVSGGGRLGDAHGGMLAAAVVGKEGLAAPELLLKDAGGGPKEVLRF